MSLSRKKTTFVVTTAFGINFIRYNRPFPSCLVSLFQSEAKSTTFLMKMSFI